MTSFGIAAVQCAGKKSGNLNRLDAEIRTISKRYPWVQMVVLGELAVHGASLEFAEDENGPTLQHFQALAKALNLWIIPGSLYEKRGRDIYNVSHVINPQGEVVARHDKLFPFLPYEKNITPGENYCVFDVPDIGRIGVAICYDMWFPEVIRTLCAMGAEAILLPTMTNTIDRDVELSIARANAAVNQCYFIDVNVAGELGNGRSVFYGPGGELLHECGTTREIVALDLDFSRVRHVRQIGWQGLGQVMKSFRDAPVRFPFHETAQARQSALSGLGALEMPKRGAQPKTSFTPDNLRVIE